MAGAKQAKPNDLRMIRVWVMKCALEHALNSSLRPGLGARLSFIIPREVDVIGWCNTHS